ncbi:radial spoke head protein 9 homolog [Chelonus insularis]|uniref:radial spoke head protein 9 homolog n=1 Tax=Chelonus insularis TaxID=460826 RepID=UPI00158E5DDC|nr:radial spoke head protein 9 homolog [Chelonus insularis]
MEINGVNLFQTLEIFGHSGICIAPEKAQLLKNSLSLLTHENHFDKTYYWGKINGVKNDYYIAYGYSKDCLKNRVYFYSMNCNDWWLLLKVNESEELITPLVSAPFQGDPTFISTVHVDELLSYNNDEKIIKVYQTGGLLYNLKEENRLAATVKLVTDEAMIIPRGSWIKRPNGDITENEAFEGLDLNKALQTKYYLHTRLSQKSKTYNVMSSSFHEYAFDFLDNLEGDVPKGCWIIQPHLRHNMVIIRSMYWPGMTFYQQINSLNHGCLYVGNGIKNFSVPFMI